MSSKIIRDPLYNYISIDRNRDRWLLELLDSPEVQRLRRIHQLGVGCLDDKRCRLSIRWLSRYRG